jgi:hypothetical protein
MSNWLIYSYFDAVRVFANCSCQPPVLTCNESVANGKALCFRTHPANEVHVTGTFDDWSKSVKLDAKEGGLHEKLVELPSADQKYYYKVRSEPVLLYSITSSVLFVLCVFARTVISEATDQLSCRLVS